MGLWVVVTFSPRVCLCALNMRILHFRPPKKKSLKFVCCLKQKNEEEKCVKEEDFLCVGNRLLSSLHDDDILVILIFDLILSDHLSINRYTFTISCFPDSFHIVSSSLLQFLYLCKTNLEAYDVFISFVPCHFFAAFFLPRCKRGTFLKIRFSCHSFDCSTIIWNVKGSRQPEFDAKLSGLTKCHLY